MSTSGTKGASGAEDDPNVEYVVVESASGPSAAPASSDMSGLDSSIANALISSGGKAGQQFQIVKEDSEGNQVTTTVVLVPDPSSPNDLIAMAIDDSAETVINTNTAPTYEEDADEDGISGIISGHGPVFITDGTHGEDVFRPVTQSGHYIIQEIPESASDRAADPDYVVLGEGLSSSEDEEEKEEQLKGKKLAKMEKKIREEDARFLKRKRAILQQTRTLEYKYLSGKRDLDREQTKIFKLEQEIKATEANRAEVEEAIKNGALNPSDGGISYKYEVIGS